MLERLQRGHPIDDLSPAISAADIIAAQKQVRETYVDDKVRKYILEIVHATRRHDAVSLGGSPRASIALFRTGQALAAVNNRDFVLPEKKFLIEVFPAFWQFLPQAPQSVAAAPSGG